MKAEKIKEKWIHVNIPYGVWDLSDGTQFLFNRMYNPIKSRSSLHSGVKAEENRWVYGIVRQRWFSKGVSPANASEGEFLNMVNALKAFESGKLIDDFVVSDDQDI